MLTWIQRNSINIDWPWWNLVNLCLLPHVQAMNGEFMKCSETFLLNNWTKKKYLFKIKYIQALMSDDNQFDLESRNDIKPNSWS